MMAVVWLGLNSNVGFDARWVYLAGSAVISNQMSSSLPSTT